MASEYVSTIANRLNLSRNLRRNICSNSSVEPNIEGLYLTRIEYIVAIHVYACDLCGKNKTAIINGQFNTFNHTI